MRKGNFTREQAVEIVGEGAVAKVEAESCDFTNRVGFNGSVQGDDEVEFSASVSSEDKSGDDVTLIAYYYQDASDVDAHDLDYLDWQVEGFEVV